MKINSNIQAMIANGVLKVNEEKYSKSTERLSSGYKINHAEDSPAGLAISNRMHAQIKSLEKATQNSSNGINVIQTAEGAMSEVQSMLQRMNELAVKASNGTMTEADRSAIQREVDQLSSEIERIAKDTEYNAQNLLGGEQSTKAYLQTPTKEDPNVKIVDYDLDFPRGNYTIQYSNTGGVVSAELKRADGTVIPTESKDGKTTAVLDDGSKLVFKYDEATVYTASAMNFELNEVGGMKIQVGSSEGQHIQMIIPEISLETLGIDDLDLTTEEGAHKALDSIEYALEYISKSRSTLGAYQNRLESTNSSLKISVENLTQAYSTIKDVDMAEEMVEYTTLQVLVQAGTSMLTQANEQPQSALQLLQ